MGSPARCGELCFQASLVYHQEGFVVVSYKNHTGVSVPSHTGYINSVTDRPGHCVSCEPFSAQAASQGCREAEVLDPRRRLSFWEAMRFAQSHSEFLIWPLVLTLDFFSSSDMSWLPLTTKEVQVNDCLPLSIPRRSPRALSHPPPVSAHVGRSVSGLHWHSHGATGTARSPARSRDCSFYDCDE